MDFVIAVDGTAASGKGTLAGKLAAHYGLPYLDTGLLYRAVGVFASQTNPPFDEEQAAIFAERSIPETIDFRDYRTREVGIAASRVATFPGVRAGLLNFQRNFASRSGGAVLDGRDIGTVIAPHAPAKLFVTASPEVRAKRRWKQLKSFGENADLKDVLDDIQRRDIQDSNRKVAPLLKAADAHLLDTTEMSISQAFDEALRIVEQARRLLLGSKDQG